MWWKNFYFDTQDRELITLVNKVVNQRGHTPAGHKFFDASLHPHGIKALAMSREMRVAHAVVKLLDSLEEGQTEDRLRALSTLYDEVLNSAQTRLRRNTARVLIQIMKDLVRAHGDESRQVSLAHDFRRATQGTPRVVRALLERYHLVEMPEDWSQLSFDHHVHDANTKGRKNPTHLIMDAWIKGIRHLTVIYYNFVDQDAAREIMRAAEIMGISVRIGIEFSAPFRGRFVHFIWVPRGFSDTEHFVEFLAEPPLRHLMQLGRQVSLWQQRYVFLALQRWNEVHRLTAAEKLGMDIAPVCEADFRVFVGTGQPSLLHLAEFVHQSFHSQARQRMVALYTQWRTLPEGAEGDEARHRLELQIAALESMTPAAVHDAWLIPERNPDLPSPAVPPDPKTVPEVPELLRFTPLALLDWLTSLHSGYRITLNLANLGAEDVLELLWQCQGLITHLEIFNLKEWYEGKLEHLAEINSLQRAINRGSAPPLKRLIRDMLKKYEPYCGEPDHVERCAALRTILRNIPSLQGFYRTTPLRTRMGTDSTSRSQKVVGMGLVFTETLTPRGQAYFRRQRAADVEIPFHIDVHRHVSFRHNPLVPRDHWFTRLVRHIPGLGNYGYIRTQEWASNSSRTRFAEHGNIAPLGGGLLPSAPQHERRERERAPAAFYLNSRLSNVLKVLAGFIPAVCAFQYTQSWWFLAWFGPIIWFAITGVRNIIQAVMAGGGFHRSTLLRWNSHVSWTRLCDSLMYTGFSVPILELGIRQLFLQDGLGYTVGNHPILVYTCMSVANGLYLASHNIYRGLPYEAVIGNLFRSALAIPVAVFYNGVVEESLLLMGATDPLTLIQPGAAIISKTASDTVAALIEGFADRTNNVRMRRWDYQTKFKQLLNAYAQLELRFPEEDALALLYKPRLLLEKLDQAGEEVKALKISIFINALDCMHFWLYQPRAQDVFMALMREMSEEERIILARSQLVLVQEREVSQLFVDGMVGKDFGRALAFYLDKHEDYLRVMMKLGVPGHKLP